MTCAIRWRTEDDTEVLIVAAIGFLFLWAITEAGWLTMAGVVAAVIASLLGWWTARRVTSGRIATSDASDLWQAATEIRRELRAEVERHRQAELDCRRRLAAVTNDLVELKRRMRGQP